MRSFETSKSRGDMDNIEVLYVEDNQSDIELLKSISEINTPEIEFESSGSLTEIEAKLRNGVDVIICDYKLVGFDGERVFRVAQEICPDVPFIFFSGTIGEERAVKLIRDGATDFVLKENILKIPFVIKRALQEIELKKKKNHFENELSKKNELLHSLFDSLTDLVIVKGEHGHITKVNKAFCNYFKTSPENTKFKREEYFLPSKYVDIGDNHVMATGSPYHFTSVYVNDLGQERVLECTKYPLIMENETKGIISVFRDISDQVQLAEESEKDKQMLLQAEYQSDIGSFEFNKVDETLATSANLRKMLGLHNRKVISLKTILSCVHPEDRGIFFEEFTKFLDNNTDFNIEHRYVKQNEKGEFGYCLTAIKVYPWKDNFKYYGTVRETTEIREASIASLSIQEKEQNRISIELHDNVAQKLSASSMYLSTNNSDLNKVKKLIDDAIHDIRTLSRNLNSGFSENDNLKEALKYLISFSPGSDIIEIQNNYDDQRISLFVKSQVYRILQEAINNSLKHGKPSKIKISIQQHRNKMILNYQDNGVGFDDTSKINGTGIKNMKERVRNCNGLFNLSSKKGGGIKIEIIVPLEDV